MTWINCMNDKFTSIFRFIINTREPFFVRLAPQAYVRLRHAMNQIEFFQFVQKLNKKRSTSGIC